MSENKKPVHSFLSLLLSVLLALSVSITIVLFLKLWIIVAVSSQLLLLGIFSILLFFLIYWMPAHLIRTRMRPYTPKVLIAWMMLCLLICSVLIFVLSSRHTLEIVATGAKNQASKGSEVWVITQRSNWDLPDFIFDGSWEKRREGIVSYQNQPARLHWYGMFRYDTEIHFLKHPWSGIVEVIFDGEHQKYDLYSEIRGYEQVIVNKFPIDSYMSFIGFVQYAVAFIILLGMGFAIKYWLKLKNRKAEINCAKAQTNETPNTDVKNVKQNLFSMRASSHFLHETILPLIIITPFLFQIYKKSIHLDFWWDEYSTFYWYSFCSLTETVTKFSIINHHVFFHLICNIYLKIMNIDSIFELMGQPEKIRYFILAYSFVTFIYLYKIGTKFFNNFVSNIALIILVTTIPFFNFAVQLRGYSLSMMFMSILIYHLWCFENEFRWTDVAMIIISSTLLFYIMLINLYFLCAVFIFYLITGIHDRVKKKNKKEIPQDANQKIMMQENQFYKKNKYFLISFLILISIYFASLLYRPLIDNFLLVNWSDSRGFFGNDIIFTILPWTLKCFISGRYALVALILIGIACSIIGYNKIKRRIEVRKCLFCLTIIVTPSILSSFRGDLLVDRLLLTGIPAYALLVSICIYFIKTALPEFRFKKPVMVIIILLYCHITFSFELLNNDRKLLSDIERGGRRQNIYCNFYQAYYRPLKLLSDFNDFLNKHKIANQYIFLYSYEKRAFPAYLAKFEIEHSDFNKNFNDMKDQIRERERGEFYVISSSPFRFLSEISKKYPQIRCERLNSELGFHNIFQCNYQLKASK